MDAGHTGRRPRLRFPGKVPGVGAFRTQAGTPGRNNFVWDWRREQLSADERKSGTCIKRPARQAPVGAFQSQERLARVVSLLLSPIDQPCIVVAANPPQPRRCPSQFVRGDGVVGVGWIANPQGCRVTGRCAQAMHTPLQRHSAESSFTLSVCCKPLSSLWHRVSGRWMRLCCACRRSPADQGGRMPRHANRAGVQRFSGPDGI